MVDVKDRVDATIDTGAEKTKDLTEQAARPAKAAVENQLSGEDGGLMHALKDNAESAIHSVEDFVGHARDRIGASATKAGEKVQHWAEDAYDAGGNLSKEVAGLVRRYPIQSVLIGVGVGLIIGRVVRL